MTAKFVHFTTSDPLDNLIYVDTDILVFYYGPSAGWTKTDPTKVAASQAFLNRCLGTEDVVLVISNQTIAELRMAIFMGMYEARGKAMRLGRKEESSSRNSPTL